MDVHVIEGEAGVQGNSPTFLARRSGGRTQGRLSENDRRRGGFDVRYQIEMTSNNRNLVARKSNGKEVP